MWRLPIILIESLLGIVNENDENTKTNRDVSDLMPTYRLQDWNLLDIPNASVREWLEKFGVEKWLSQYGLQKCPRCGQIGLHFKSCKFYTPDHGKAFIVAIWIHPKVDSHFLLDTIGSDDGEDIPEIKLHLIGQALSAYYQALASMNRKEVWFCGDILFEKDDDRPLEICPKCGMFGEGYGVVQHKDHGVYRSERRFVHSESRTCYIRPTQPKILKEICPKCGELGRMSSSKGYRFCRHAKKVCRIGKVTGGGETDPK
jgi:hypothetical protein